MLDWKLYEDAVLKKFRGEFPDANLLPNQKIEGYLSKSKRQVDILIKGSIVGHPVIGAIECKYFNKKIDVKTVDSFIGFLEDIRANLGILITNKGFTPAAKNLAESRKIKIEIIEFDQLQYYHFDWDSCEPCLIHEVGHREVEWHSRFFGKCKRKKIYIKVGQCSYCNTTHVKCEECGSVISIWDDDYDEGNECACGNKIIVENEYVGEGMQEEAFYLQCGSNRVRFSSV